MYFGQYNTIATRDFYLGLGPIGVCKYHGKDIFLTKYPARK